MTVGARPMPFAMRSTAASVCAASATASGSPASESALRPRASAVVDASSARATHVAVNVFVAATSRSTPARNANTCSALRPSAESGRFVNAIVTAPARRPSATTAATSGDAPDCEMPITAPRTKLGGASYRVTRDGAASAVTIPAMLSSRYLPYVAALSEEPRATSVTCSTRARARPSPRTSGQPSSRRRRTTAGCCLISSRRDIARMMPERYFRYRTSRSLDARETGTDARPRAVKELGSVPPGRRRWRRTLRTGLFWIALGLGSATLSYACDPVVAARSLGFQLRETMVFFALVPIPALALGVRSLALALRLRAASDLADRAVGYLEEHLPESFVVVSHFGPRDGGDVVPVVIVGPPGVLVVQPRDDEGEVVCCQDVWYR